MSFLTPSRPRLSPAFVESQRLGHKILGVGLGAVLYLLCITGVICVFYVEYERWEKPGLPEMSAAAPEAVARAVVHAQRLAAESAEPVNDIFVILPNPDMPRLVAAVNEEHIGFDAAGHPVGLASHDLTHFIMELHYSLHLPSTLGLIVVGIMGIVLLALAIGGALSLPRMFRDAFRLRWSGTERVTRIDIHNRLGVWGLPFHLMTALTGAIMGLAQLVFTITAFTQFDGDLLKAFDQVFGPGANPALERAVGPAPMDEARITRAIISLQEAHPENPPLFLGIRDIGLPGERLEVWAGHPDRLIYGEAYLFDASGELTGAIGYADGAAGQQIYGSMFRLHAGAYGGIWVKLAYVVMGLGLCWICVSGIDIWFLKAAAKGHRHPRLRQGWGGLIWGIPALVAVAAIGHIGLDLPAVPVFWIGLPALLLVCLALPERFGDWPRRQGPVLLGGAMILLAAIHVARFGTGALTQAGLQVDLPLALIGLALILSRPLGARIPTRQRVEAAVAGPAE